MHIRVYIDIKMLISSTHHIHVLFYWKHMLCLSVNVSVDKDRTGFLKLSPKVVLSYQHDNDKEFLMYML